MFADTVNTLEMGAFVAFEGKARCVWGNWLEKECKVGRYRIEESVSKGTVQAPLDVSDQ